MNILKIFFLCPVPEDQKPIGQYISLKEKIGETIGKGEFRQNSFFQRIEKLSFLSDFTPNIFFFFLFSFFQPLFFLLFLVFLIFFFLFCLQVEKKLIQSRFLYEEGSWYETQIWEKPLGVIKSDRFLSSQKPILPFFFLF